MLRCFSVDHNTILFQAVLNGLTPFFAEEWKKVAVFITMYKIVKKKVSVDATKFFDGFLRRPITGKLKLRVSTAKSRVSSESLTCLGKYEDLARHSDQKICQRLNIRECCKNIFCGLLFTWLMVTFSSLYAGFCSLTLFC